MKVNIELDENDLKVLALSHIRAQLGDLGDKLDINNVKFLVKSVNNYKPQEWEKGMLKVEIISTDDGF